MKLFLRDHRHEPGYIFLNIQEALFRTEWVDKSQLRHSDISTRQKRHLGIVYSSPCGKCLHNCVDHMKVCVHKHGYKYDCQNQLFQTFKTKRLPILEK